MKKENIYKFLYVVSIFLIIAFVIMFWINRGGKISEVNIFSKNSEIYTEKEINDAIDVTLKYFKQNFKGCSLLEIAYIGDETNINYQEFAEQNNADEVIVLISSFEVGSSGGDGSLNPNDTYKGWKWILVRNENGNWRHVDHGY